jgi:hypothetical protein
MPKTARPRGRAVLAAVALVPRQHAAPASGSEAPAISQRPSSGRAVAGAGGRARVAVLAFLLGFAACYVVLKYPGDPPALSHPRASLPAPGRTVAVP